MRVVATDFYILYRPSLCDLRVFLRHRGVAGEPRSAFDAVIERLGRRHEDAHLATIPQFVDLRAGDLEERRRATQAAVTAHAPAIYQPVLIGKAELNGVACEVVGQPDFLVLEEDRYIVRDSKLARRINETDHPEIIAQLGLYGWLFEQTFSTPPARLQIHAGSGALVEIAYDAGAAALATLERIVATRIAAEAPYSPIGWSKCGGCEYKPRCWQAAEDTRDLARVAGVDQSLAITLRTQGVTTPECLLETFDEPRLASLLRPWGKKQRPVGDKTSRRIITMARVLASGKLEILQQPVIPEHHNYVMFDVEGLPPFLDALDKIYLWGTKVHGANASAFRAAIAGFGPQGDSEGWFSLLEHAREIFAQYGDIPFVHWHHYESTQLKRYLARYGDRDDVAARVQRNLMNLLPIAEESVALPIPSYSLKVIEKHIGFRRALEEGTGDWAMATFIEATETEDAIRRDELMARIRAYNEEDLDAMWAVLQWLRNIRNSGS